MVVFLGFSEVVLRVFFVLITEGHGKKKALSKWTALCIYSKLLSNFNGAASAWVFPISAARCCLSSTRPVAG